MFGPQLGSRGAASTKPATSPPLSAVAPDAPSVERRAATSAAAESALSYAGSSSGSTRRCARWRSASSAPAAGTCSAANGTKDVVVSTAALMGGTVDGDDPGRIVRTDGSPSSGRTISRGLGSGGEPEDADRRGAPARRRPGEGRGALPRGRQQPRLPGVLRAPRGAADDLGAADERAARVH